MRRYFAFVMTLVMTLNLLPMTVWAANQPFTHHGVEVYTKTDNNGYGTYDDWSTHDGLCLIKVGQAENKEHDAVRVEYTPGQTKRLFLNASGATIMEIRGGLRNHTTYNLDADTGIYELVLSDSASGNGNVDVRFVPQNDSQNDLDIMFVATGNQGGNAQGQTPFALDGIEVYTKIDENNYGTYEDWGTHDGLEVTKAGPDNSRHNAVRVPYTPGEEKSIFLKGANSGIEITSVRGGLKTHAIYSIVPDTDIYELTLLDSASGNGNVWVNLKSGNGFDIMFEAVENQGNMLSGSPACGAMGVFFFGGLDFQNKQLIAGSDVRNENGKVVVSCAGNTSRTIFLAANKYDTLSVSGGTLSQENFTWMDNNAVCKVYALTVNKPANGNKVEYTVTRSWGSENPAGGESVSLVFDFRETLGGSSACGRGDVFFFSGIGKDDKGNNVLYGSDDIWDRQDGTFVSCAGVESKTIYLAVGNWNSLSVSGASLELQDFKWRFIPREEGGSFDCDVYALTVDKPADGSRVECMVTYSWGGEYADSESFPLVFDFDLQPGGGNPEDNRRTLEYYTARGYSKIIVTVDPAVERVVAFPEPGVLENDTLLLTVKSADPEDWRPLLNGEDHEFWIGYRVEAIAPPEGVTEDPMVAFDDNININSALYVLAEKIAGNQFHSYELTGNDPVRVNSVQFAWRTSGFGDVQILPEEQYMARAWCWRYSEDGSADQTDWFAAQVVLGDGVGDIITVPGYPVVAEDRIQLIAHEELDKVLAFDEYEDGSFKYQDGQNGVLTYTYVGVDTEKTSADAIYEAAAAEKAADVVLRDNWIYYDLLKVAAPDGYTAKKVECAYEEQRGFDGDGSEVVLHFFWEGEFRNVTFTLTWCDADPNDANVLQDRVEQVTIYMPDAFDSEPWMAHAVIGGVDHVAKPVDASRLSFASLDGVKGVKSHVYDEAKGVLFTTYDNDSIIDTAPILDAWFYVEAPEGAVSFHAMRSGDGTSNPAYNSFNAWKSEFFWEGAVTGQPVRIEDVDGMNRGPIEALLKQTYGDDIEYYYSADKWTRYLLIQWNFKDKDPMYEYLQFDTSSYHCQWKEEVKKDSEVTGEVKIPTAINDLLANGDIMLVADIHAQTTAKKFFFELEMVDEGTGNVITEFDGNSFIIILPYEFMGNDPNGNPWRYETAVKMKEAKIKHFDDDFTLKDNNGVIFGTFTPRGIEFVVDSFSPFMLELEDKEIESSGSSSSGGSSIIPADSTTTKTETKVNEDGSTTTTTTTNTTSKKSDGTTIQSETVTETTKKADGTEITTSKTEITSSNGSKSTTTVDETGKVEAEVTVSGKAVTDAAKSDESVVLPMPELPVVRDSEIAPTVAINLPVSAGETKVEIPVTNPTAGTVVVIVNADGTEEILKDSAMTENGVTATLSGDATVKVVDNSQDFADVKSNDWFSDASQFVSSREIMSGTGNGSFAPAAEASRAMIAVILHSLENDPENTYTGSFGDVGNTWYTDSVKWAAENGIMSGTGNGNFGADDSVTREQLAVTLFAYANKKGIDTTADSSLDAFGDAENASEWAKAALEWAVHVGLLSGKGDGLLDPTGTASRAEIAQILMAFCNKVAQ